MSKYLKKQLEKVLVNIQFLIGVNIIGLPMIFISIAFRIKNMLILINNKILGLATKKKT